MKKLLAFISIIIIAFAALPFVSCGGTATVEYKLSEDGTYYIVDGVSGNRSALKSYDVPAEYAPVEGGAALPVKVIGDEAFMNCSSLYTVTLPEGIKHIGVRAFMNCAFKYFTIPGSVEKIDSAAFGSCDALIEIIIPESVKVIGPLAFAYCDSLERAVVRAQITELREKAFYNSYAVAAGNVYTSTSLTEIYLPSTLEKIHVTALDGNFIENIHFAGSEEQWDKLYFYEYVKKEGTENETVEKKTKTSDIISSSTKLHYDSVYQTAE